MRNLRKLSKATFWDPLPLNTILMRHVQVVWTQNLQKKNKMIWTKLSDEKLKGKLSTCGRPGNCENVTGTKVNPEVWSKIRSGTRSRDLKLQRLQNVIQKATILLIKLTDQCMKREISSLKLSDENVARTLLDVIALLGYANCELIQRRRNMIRPDLNIQYQ